MKKLIPNTLTSMNTLSGCVAIVLAFNGNEYLIYASLMILIAAVFDFFDGMSARLLKAYSDIGKDLDSLADAVSFGVAPAVIVYQLLKTALFNGVEMPLEKIGLAEFLFMLIPFLLAVFSSLRLAKFNNDSRQSDSFIGLPTPANALLIASLPVVLSFNSSPFWNELILSPAFLIILTVVESYLLVSEFPMFSLKFKNLSFSKNKIRYIFLISNIVLVVFMREIGVMLIIPLFVVLSGINNWIYKF